MTQQKEETKVVGDAGQLLDAVVTFGFDEDCHGLILESWGPKDRNRDYNIALETILGRIIRLGIVNLQIILISRPSLKHFTQQQRTFSVDGSSLIDISNYSAENLRKVIGKWQAETKQDPSTKGGNWSKRILLYSPSLSCEQWKAVVLTSNYSELVLSVYGKPTSVADKYEQAVHALLQLPVLEKPEGNSSPRKLPGSRNLYERDPKVKAWVLSQAGSNCEACGLEAPFKKDNGLPYLETHHVKPLGEYGSDSVENVIAVCPNCHRAFHFSTNRLVLADDIYKKVVRLLKKEVE